MLSSGPQQLWMVAFTRPAQDRTNGIRQQHSPSTNGTQWVTAPTQRHEGGRGHVEGYLGKWKGELGSNLIKLYYTQLPNCQRINKRYFFLKAGQSK